MRKIILIAMFFCSCAVFAQTESQTSDVLVNKKGVPILPVAGDWGLGISASPFLAYTGNLFTDAYNPAPVFTSANPGFIYGKYFLSNSTAVRAGLRIGLTSETEKIATATPDEYSKETVSALNLGLSVGIEKYKSLKSRLRGYYGADVFLTKTPYYDGTTGNSGKYSYKDATDQTFDEVEKGGNTYEIGAQGVIGLEYFFAPKMSVSSEFGVMLYGSKTGERTYIPEDGTPETVTDPGGSGFGIRTNTTSLINLFFYF